VFPYKHPPGLQCPFFLEQRILSSSLVHPSMEKESQPEFKTKLFASSKSNIKRAM
jgi:hypothetical protein